MSFPRSRLKQLSMLLLPERAKILHLIPDEKITNDIINSFNNISSHNVFIVYSPDNRFKHLTVDNDSVVKSSDISLNQWITESQIQSIVVHGFQFEFAEAICKLTTNIKIAWIAWGFDVYDLPRIRPKSFGKLTKKYLFDRDHKFRIQLFIKKNDFLRKIVCKFFLKQPDYYGITVEAQSKVKYFCSYIKEDFECYSAYYSNSQEFFEMAFSSIKQYLAGNELLRIHSNAANVLVGNSNTPENNHLDALDIISKVDTESTEKIIFPLSYGDDILYKKYLLKTGKYKLGEKFYALDYFMNREEYIRTLQTCSTGVFYHYRQQAMGNIIAMLYMGSRIYMSSKNPAYLYLKRIGAVVFDLDVDFQKYKNTILPKKDADTNREILNAIFSKSKVENDMRNLVEKLINVHT